MTRIYYGKCACGWIKTDYPFMSCEKCGYIGCGSKEELEKARQKGKLIEWQDEPPKGKTEIIMDCRLPKNQCGYRGDGQ